MTTASSIPPPFLDVESYYVEELLFRAYAEHDETKESSGAVDVDMHIERHADNVHDFRLTMRINIASARFSAEENPAYGIALTMVGYFTFSDGADEAAMQRMIRLNGSSILYGIARGLIGQASGASLHGQFVLPTVNFVDWWKARVEKEASEAAENTTADVSPKAPPNEAP